MDKRSAAAKRLKRRLEVRTSAKVAVEAQLGVETGVHVDVAGASAHVDVAGAKTGVVANDQWQTAVDPKTGVTYYYNPKTKETSWVRPVH